MDEQRKPVMCPFLAEIVMQYCEAHPVRKLIPKHQITTASPCSGSGHMACPLFLECTNRPPIQEHTEPWSVHGLLLHPDRYYHPGHTWAMYKDKHLKVGLDDLGRRLLGDISRIELPAVGAGLRQGEPSLKLECGGKSAHLVSPVNGHVTAVNHLLERDATLLQRDPYGEGWLFSVSADENAGLADLLTGSAAVDWLGRELDHLSIFFNEELGTTAADGGELVPQAADLLSPTQWEKLVETVFRVHRRTKNC